MIVEEVIEHEDGSSTLKVQMTNEETRLIIETALRIGLIKGIQMAEQEALKEMNENS